MARGSRKERGHNSRGMSTAWLATGLLLVGVILHLGLTYPAQVVFDEVHFGKFVTAYCCTGQRFFDIHPPHAKLLIAGTAKFLGYAGNFDFDHIGEPYGDVNILALRIFPALMGILLPLIFFGLLRQMGVSWQISWLGGFAVALDNALIVQTRMIALDGLLLVATFGALLAYSKKYYVLAGALAGLAAGTKFTGLAVLALLGALVIFNFSARSADPPWWRTIFKRLSQGLIIFLCAAVVYLAGWWLHFALLPNPGPGDAWGVPTGNFWQDTVKLHRTMLSANYHLTATHPDESAAWTWPLMTTAIFYWSAPNGEVIYFLGNPMVWWGSSILFLIALVSTIRKKFSISPASRDLAKRDSAQFPKLWIPFAGFLIAYVPLLRVPRALFLYHYLTPLLFALAFGLVWLDWKIQNPKSKIQMVIAAIILITGFFMLFSPITYGLDVSSAWRQALYWLPGWR